MLLRRDGTVLDATSRFARSDRDEAADGLAMVRGGRAGRRPIETMVPFDQTRLVSVQSLHDYPLVMNVGVAEGDGSGALAAESDTGRPGHDRRGLPSMLLLLRALHQQFDASDAAAARDSLRAMRN